MHWRPTDNGVGFDRSELEKKDRLDIRILASCNRWPGRKYEYRTFFLS